MNCPACSTDNPSSQKYCVRCRLSFTRLNLLASRCRDHFYWILRRANGGFLAGFIAWLFIPAFSRILSQHAGALLQYSVTGFLGGAFLGMVDGMLEESTPKTVLGGVMGGIGGAVGGFLFGSFADQLTTSTTLWGIFAFWALAGALIGLVSALWERQRKKLIFGAVSGLIGGGMGGALGYAMYASIIQDINPQTWILARLSEGLSGGIIGVTLWFFIGMAERFVIFKRRLVKDATHKVCDHCQNKNSLSSWYCGECGSVLQVSAPPARLNLSPYTTLDRLRQLFRFLSRLSSATGIIAGLVTFVLFIPVNPFLALVALILVAILSTSFLILFSSFSESIKIFINKKQ